MTNDRNIDGFQSTDTLPEHTARALRELMNQSELISFDDVSVRPSPLGLDAIVNCRWEETRGSGENRTTITVRRTVVLLHRPESKLPPFWMVRHEGWFAFRGATGDPRAAVVDFTLRPLLARRLTISSLAPRSARVLFDDTLLDAIDACDGLEAHGNHHGVLVWRASAVLKDEARGQLIRDAFSVFGPPLGDPTTGERIAGQFPGSYAEEMLAHLKANPTKANQRILRNYLTRARLDKFLAQQPPRRPSRVIRRHVLGSNMVFIVIMGLITLFFVTVGVLALVESIQTQWTPTAFLGLIGLAGLTAEFFLLRWRGRRMRTLTWGQLATATVSNVRSDPPALKRKITLAVNDPALIGDVELKLGPAEARIAEYLKYGKQSTTVLVGPDAHPTIIWLEGWVVENRPD